MELDVVRGTLDLMILKALSWGPMHGLAVLRWIEQTTKEQLQIEEGALYPSLHRMEDKGWLDADWGNRSGTPRRSSTASPPAGASSLRPRSHVGNGTPTWSASSSARAPGEPYDEARFS